MKLHYILRVSGKVQGVFFRASARDKAKDLGLAGIVRNEKDGSVYIEAEGEKLALDQLEQWCHQGPRIASVAKVEKTEGLLKGYTDFKIA